jgi:hypothetical protein
MSNSQGLGEERGNRTFLKVRGKEFVMVAENPNGNKEAIDQLLADGWKANPWTVGENSGVNYEKRFPNLTGKLVQAFEHDGKYAVEQKFVVEIEGGDTFQFSAKKYMNTQVENLMNRMCNDDFDPNLVVKLVPYKKPKENKDGYNEGVMIFNADDKGRYINLVTKAFTVKEPGDCPSWDKKKKAGKTEWNNDATMEFLSNAVEEKMKTVTAEVAETSEADSTDDIPF